MSVDPKKPILLTFVGMVGSGKDTCADYLQERYKIPSIYFGGMVYDEVAKRGLDAVLDERYVREDMRAKEGPAVLAKRVAAKVEEYIKEGKKRIILNGLYSWSEYKYLSEEFGDQFVCIAIAMPRLLRYKRVLNRKDPHRSYTLPQIIQREIDEIEHLEKGGPIARADYTLNNSESQEGLFKQLDDVLKEIGF